mmetsp:Transcript_2899/g.6234  ORF Transcript_2899/g.6234 Transcript_2899/m.6234 type:complete len:222 (+) Transcript_2899:565-1230(+)
MNTGSSSAFLLEFPREGRNHRLLPPWRTTDAVSSFASSCCLWRDWSFLTVASWNSCSDLDLDPEAPVPDELTSEDAPVDIMSISLTPLGEIKLFMLFPMPFMLALRSLTEKVLRSFMDAPMFFTLDPISFMPDSKSVPLPPGDGSAECVVFFATASAASASVRRVLAFSLAACTASMSTWSSSSKSTSKSNSSNSLPLSSSELYSESISSSESSSSELCTD